MSSDRDVADGILLEHLPDERRPGTTWVIPLRDAIEAALARVRTEEREALVRAIMDRLLPKNGEDDLAARIWDEWGHDRDACVDAVRQNLDRARAEEREACAKVADNEADSHVAIAAAIRARQTPTGTGEMK